MAINRHNCGAGLGRETFRDKMTFRGGRPIPPQVDVLLSGAINVKHPSYCSQFLRPLLCFCIIYADAQFWSPIIMQAYFVRSKSSLHVWRKSTAVLLLSWHLDRHIIDESTIKPAAPSTSHTELNSPRSRCRICPNAHFEHMQSHLLLRRSSLAPATMNIGTTIKSSRTMPSPTSQISVSKVKATDITAHVASDPSLCVDLTTTFRQDSLLISKRRQAAPVNVDPPAEDSSPKIKQEEEEEPSTKTFPRATNKLTSIANDKKKSVSFASTSRMKIIKPINPDTTHHIWFTKEEHQMMQNQLSEDVRKTRKITKQLRRSTSREESFKLEKELRSIPTRGLEHFKSTSTYKKIIQEQRAVIDGVLNAQDEYWRRDEEVSQASSIDQASKTTEELILAQTSCTLSLSSRERAFEDALQDEAVALEIYKHMLHNGKKKQKVPAREL